MSGTPDQFRQGVLRDALPRSFGTLAPDDLEAIEARFTWRRLDRGEVLFREGAPATPCTCW